MNNKSPKIWKKTLFLVAIFVIVLFCAVMTYAKEWSLATYGQVPFSQIIFHLKVPVKGTSTDIVSEVINGFIDRYGMFLLLVLLGEIIYGFFDSKGYIKCSMSLGEIKGKIRKLDFHLIFKICVTVGLCVVMILKLSEIWEVFGISEYIDNLNASTKIYEEHYVDTGETDIEFPKDKKNLIFIFLESMETSYTSKEFGGGLEYNLIPNLTKLALENQEYEGNKLVGAYAPKNTGWTVAAMTAQTSSLPLSLPIGCNSYGRYQTFLPGATTLGDILKEEGYNQMIMMGSDADFGGRRDYFKQHGDYYIYDLPVAKKYGKIPKDYYENWGYEDIKLFEYAKEEILKMAEKNEPFNMTLLTVDTHFPRGYKCEECEDVYPESMKNAILCSDKQVYEFVEWIKLQEFYEDTVIVISGDHTNMSTSVDTWIGDESYDRTTYFAILNGEEKLSLKNRRYTTLDIFPTVLSAMGVNIQGEKLALGVNLFSDEKTLAEIYGFEGLDKELEKNSRFYSEEILYEERDGEK